MIAVSCLAVAVLSLGWAVTSTAERPSTGGPYGVAMALPGMHVKPEAGLSVQMAVRVGTSTFSCDRAVEVSILFSGTRHFWREHRPLPRWTPFSISVVEFGIHDADLHFAANSVEALAPAVPEAANRSSTLAPDSDLRLEPQEQFYLEGNSEPAGVRFAGRIHDWDRTWAPLVLSFQADWTASRALGSCYLRLPPLSGPLAGGAQQVATGAFKHSRQGISPVSFDAPTASIGETSVATSGEIDSAASTPSPTAQAETSDWSCQVPRDLGGGSVSPTGKVLVGNPQDVISTELPSCATVAVVKTSAAEPMRVVLLLMVGALLGAIPQALSAALTTTSRGRTKQQ